MLDVHVCQTWLIFLPAFTIKRIDLLKKHYLQHKEIELAKDFFSFYQLDVLRLICRALSSHITKIQLSHPINLLKILPLINFLWSHISLLPNNNSVQYSEENIFCCWTFWIKVSLERIFLEFINFIHFFMVRFLFTNLVLLCKRHLIKIN